MNKYTRGELVAAKFDSLTMGDLRKFISKNPQIKDDIKVLVERVEDSYFNGSDISGMSSGDGILPERSNAEGWKVLPVEGEHYYNTKNFNEKMRVEIELRKEGKGEYSKGLITESAIVELTDDLKEQFFPAWCISKDKDDQIVYIFNHY